MYLVQYWNIDLQPDNSIDIFNTIQDSLDYISTGSLNHWQQYVPIKSQSIILSPSADVQLTFYPELNYTGLDRLSRLPKLAAIYHLLLVSESQAASYYSE